MADVTWLIELLPVLGLVLILAVVTDQHWPPDELRNLGIYILAYKGSGKSRFMGRVVCLGDLLRGIPQIIIDGLGGLISNVLDAVMRLPAPQRRQAISRLAYYDMSGKLTGHVCPLPLFYRFGRESWNDVGSRYLQTVLALDSHMRSAPILGANQFLQIGQPVNQILAASGWQMTEARLLLDRPADVKQHLKALKAEADDWVLREACDWYLSQYMSWDSKKRSQETVSYRRKVDLLLRDNATVAMFGASSSDLLLETEQQRRTVLLDFSGDQQNPDLMMFKMNWVVEYCLNYFKHRVEQLGPGLHLQPFGLVIDELAQLTNFDATSGSEVDVFAKKIGEFLDQYGRQGMIYLTLANQEMYQISEQLFKTLLGCGTVMCGLTSDWEASVYLAKQFMPAQPHRIKRHEPIYRADDTIRSYRPVDMSLDEQIQKTAAMFRNLKKFQFLVKEVSNPRLWLLDTSDLDPGLYPNAERVRELKVMLSRRYGRPIDQLLAEIQQRQESIRHHQPGASQKRKPKDRVKPDSGSDILPDNEQPDEPPNHLPGEGSDDARGDLDDLWS